MHFRQTELTPQLQCVVRSASEQEDFSWCFATSIGPPKLYISPWKSYKIHAAYLGCFYSVTEDGYPANHVVTHYFVGSFVTPPPPPQPPIYKLESFYSLTPDLLVDWFMVHSGSTKETINKFQVCLRTRITCYMNTHRLYLEGSNT